MEICSLIMEVLEDKNPVMSNGWTPLHSAAREGHLEICSLFMANLVDKNPGKKNGWTPLHSAALQGNFEIAQIWTSVSKVKAKIIHFHNCDVMHCVFWRPSRPERTI